MNVIVAIGGATFCSLHFPFWLHIALAAAAEAEAAEVWALEGDTSGSRASLPKGLISLIPGRRARVAAPSSSALAILISGHE